MFELIQFQSEGVVMRGRLYRARSRAFAMYSFAMYSDDTRDLGYNPSGRGGLCQHL
jgi:hypothetical protein